jgi:hypothetical protein
MWQQLVASTAHSSAVLLPAQLKPDLTAACLLQQHIRKQQNST